MTMGVCILIPVLLPVIAGALLLLPLQRDKIGEEADQRQSGLSLLHRIVGSVMAVSAAVSLIVAWTGADSFTWFELMEGLPVYFHIDDVGRLFITVISIVWVLVCFYSFTYMEHEGKERRFFAFYLIVYGILAALCFSGNLVTLYLFYELMTLASMPMVLHSGTHEAVMAALKYLFYSLCGAYMGLFGIFFLYKYCDSLTFTAGGTLNLALADGHTGILLAAVFLMIIGFGAKAGMFPLHAWLPAAHPVAPSPASAVLSGIIAKVGVLAVIRVVYYIVGSEFIRGTWVQTAWMVLALLTVFMGSMLAVREPVFKKRLAYSTVSQVSYILFGLAVLSQTAMEGALLHVVSHAFAKCTLFLTAGIFLYRAGFARVEQLDGIGKKMPKTLWCYTLAALTLVGIPPTSGFISKWYLAQGSLEAELGGFSWVGPAILLLSALLTAAYLLTIMTNGFFPKKKEPVAVSARESGKENADCAGAAGKQAAELTEAPVGMLVPLAILAAIAVLLGVFPNPLIRFVSEIAASVL
ncbi:MAG: proton-conducting membrane transporter [Lachnospiraceae bacterium]|nr:proton-conducting membrane transporter [Lachnospiraceae bacterium]